MRFIIGLELFVIVTLCAAISLVAGSGRALSAHKKDGPTGPTPHSLVVTFATGKVGNEVRAFLRSLATHVPGSNVLLVADKVVWSHFRHDVTTQNIQGLNLLVMNYDMLLATSPHTFSDKQLAHFYCLSKALEALFNSPDAQVKASEYAWFNATQGKGIERNVGAVLLVDSTKTVIQRDPFQQFWFEANKHFHGKTTNTSGNHGMIVVSEEWPRAVEKCPDNREAVKVCFGESVLPYLGNVYSSGSMMASPHVMHAFLKHAALPVLKLCHKPVTGMEQAMFNLILHYPQYSQDKKAKAAFESNAKAHDVFTLIGNFYNHFQVVMVKSSATSGWLSSVHMNSSHFDDQKMQLLVKNTTKVDRACALCYRYDQNSSWSRRVQRLYNTPLNASLPSCHTDADVYDLGSSCHFAPSYEDFYQEVREVLAKKKKIPMCLSMIAWQGFETLTNTLNSYVKNHLLDYVEESQILFQEIHLPLRQEYMRHFVKQYPQFSRPPIVEQENIKFKAIGQLARNCSSKYILLVTEDFAMYVEDQEEIVEELLIPTYMHQHHGVSAMRMRRRHNMGLPEYPRWRWDRAAQIDPEFEIHLAAWQDEVEDDFPNLFEVCHRSPKTWCTTSKHAAFTSHPTAYETNFLKSVLNVAEDEGRWNWCREDKNIHKLAVAGGLFTLDRLDRAMMLP